MEIFGYTFTAFFTLLSFFINPQQQIIQNDNGIYVCSNDMHAYSAKVPDTDGSTEIAYSIYETIILSETLSEKYPALAEYIDELNIMTEESAQVTFNDIVHFIEEDEFYFNLPYYEEHYARIYRCDDNIFSLKETILGYTGGAHGYDLVGCTNLDPNTGEELELSDVITDDSNLAVIIDIAIRKEYPDEYEYMHNVYDALLSYDTDDFNWTMTNDCLYINFNTYEIATYAAGQITAPLYFADYPGLVKSKYTDVEENSFVRSISNSDYLYLTDKYGNHFFVNLSSYPNYKTGIFEELSVTLPDKRIEFTTSKCHSMKSWHARSASGMNYLITELKNEDDKTVTLEIYLIEMNDVEKIRTLDNTEMPKIPYDNPNSDEKYIKPIFTSWDKVAGFIE